MEFLSSILTSIEAIVGMIATLLLLSLFGTIILELLSAWRGWRGLYSEEMLKRLLEFRDNPNIYNNFIQNPLYRQHLQHKAPFRLSQAPAYLSGNNFVSILINVLKKEDGPPKSIHELLNGLPFESSLRKVLQQFYDDGNTDISSYKARMQEWYSDISHQAGGWYKRHLLFNTFMVSLGLAAVLNVDTLRIYRQYVKNANNRQKISVLFEKINNVEAKLDILVDSTQIASVAIANSELETIKDELSELGDSNDIGLGWSYNKFVIGFPGWVNRIIGWLITAIAMSLFTPLCFDLLKKLVSNNSSNTVNPTHGNQIVINTGQGND